MPTYYRPTERRGKRVVYTSTDPAEPTKEMVRGFAALIAIALFLVFAWLLSK